MGRCKADMRQLEQNVFSVGALDWEARLFDKLIPLPDGTSYNAYLIKGNKKTALLDTVDPSKADALVDNLVAAGITRLDYLVAQHAEQDHSGSIPDVLALHPETKIVTNSKCRDLLADHLHLDPETFSIIEDGQTLDLGGKTLRFVFTPWVHWPETMCTYLEEDAILFSCDFFGSHLATSRLFVENERDIYEPAKRYYAEIMMPFRTAIRKNLNRIAQLDVAKIAPSHGPVYARPAFITEAYAEWASDKVKNEAVLAYVSMHGSSRAMVDRLSGALAERGICVRRYDLGDVDVGKLAMSMVDAATIVIGCGTVLAGPHPKAVYACALANALRPKTRFASIIGSYGWSSRVTDQISALLPNLKVQMLEPLLVKGAAREEDFLAVERLADRILEAHKSLGIADAP